ncbi:MAG: DegT/DnrJ/EryC1/StrS family aminotransferase, partial [Proteobacteria bacterium]|nr:DegT/DnrJ/EryC1/StrS family aminotransferase [Pseudomonadota bacterium]
LLPDLDRRTAFIDRLRKVGINCVFHYIPLHSAPAGQRLGRTHGDLKVTDEMSDRLVRLPLWLGLEDAQAEVIQQILASL